MEIRFIDWDFKYRDIDDGSRIHWTEFYFEDSEDKLVGKSPVYTEGASDFYCLGEDTLKVVRQLREGASWEQVCDQFRQAW